MTYRRRNGIIVAAALAAATAGFLAFRPDTLFTDVRANEALAEAFPTSTADSSAVAPPITGAAGVTAPPTAATAEAVIAGSFTGIDHQAAGTATVYQEDGRYVLRFEDDTDIQNGPDLYVWLLASAAYEGGTPGAHLDLGTLTGNVGGQNYSLPGDFDPDIHRTVLIWCLRFAVPFASAPMS